MRPQRLFNNLTWGTNPAGNRANKIQIAKKGKDLSRVLKDVKLIETEKPIFSKDFLDSMISWANNSLYHHLYNLEQIKQGCPSSRHDEEPE